MLKTAASPRILEGKRAIVFGGRLTRTAAHNLNEDYVYKRTGVRIQDRRMESASSFLSAGRSKRQEGSGEVERGGEPSDKTIVDACRLYVLLRSIIEKEGLSGASIHCLGLQLRNMALPYPCLAFARLRDEGFTAACEAHVCGMLSSMFLQQTSRKPSFLSKCIVGGFIQYHAEPTAFHR